MKIFALSTMAVLAMSAFARAGGDIAPVEPVIEEVVVPDESGFYVGLAYGYADISQKYSGFDGGGEFSWSEKLEDNFDTIMLQAGYKFNKYLALEGRYWGAVGDGDWTDTWDGGSSGSDSDFSAWGVYVKPMYPVTEEFAVYALLGYGNVNYDSHYVTDTIHNVDDEGFQWGLGASYEFTDNFAVFSDYVELYNDDVTDTWDGGQENVDSTIYTVNIGVTYKF